MMVVGIDVGQMVLEDLMMVLAQMTERIQLIPMVHLAKILMIAIGKMDLELTRLIQICQKAVGLVVVPS